MGVSSESCALALIATFSAPRLSPSPADVERSPLGRVWYTRRRFPSRVGLGLQAEDGANSRAQVLRKTSSLGLQVYASPKEC